MQLGQYANVGVQMNPVEALRLEKSPWVRIANRDYLQQEEVAERQSRMMACRRYIRRQHEKRNLQVDVGDETWFKKHGERHALDFLEHALLIMACKDISDEEVDGEGLERRREGEQR